MEKSDSVFRCTGQAWKFWVMEITGLLAIALAVAVIWMGNSMAMSDRALLFLLAAVFGIGGFAFACISIKCPNCSARWFWNAVSTKKDGGGAKWHAQSACPVCGKTCRELTKK